MCNYVHEMMLDTWWVLFEEKAIVKKQYDMKIQKSGQLFVSRVMFLKFIFLLPHEDILTKNPFIFMGLQTLTE